MTSEFSPPVRTWSEMTFFESSSRSKLCLEHDPSGQARGQAFSENRYPARITSGPGFFGIMLWSRAFLGVGVRVDQFSRLGLLGPDHGLNLAVTELIEVVGLHVLELRPHLA